jgi:hydrogenase expression/formation protein HypC
MPGKVVEINGDTAEIDFGGVIKQTNISMVEATVGQWVVIHAGFAINVMDEEDAQETIALWNEFLDHDGVTYQ